MGSPAWVPCTTPDRCRQRILILFCNAVWVDKTGLEKPCPAAEHDVVVESAHVCVCESLNSVPKDIA